MMFAKVCVDVVTGSDDLFTYAVPEIYRDYIYVGSRVFVEFGFQKPSLTLSNSPRNQIMTARLKKLSRSSISIAA